LFPEKKIKMGIWDRGGQLKGKVGKEKYQRLLYKKEGMKNQGPWPRVESQREKPGSFDLIFMLSIYVGH